MLIQFAKILILRKNRIRAGRDREVVLTRSQLISNKSKNNLLYFLQINFLMNFRCVLKVKLNLETLNFQNKHSRYFQFRTNLFEHFKYEDLKVVITTPTLRNELYFIYQDVLANIKYSIDQYCYRYKQLFHSKCLISDCYNNILY